MTENCLFCRIVAGEIPAQVVHETGTTLAFRDVAPQAPVHVLVIPKSHYANAAEAGDSPGVLADVLGAAFQIAVTEGVADSGYRLVTNTGADGGQSVGHLHFHLLGGRSLQWPPG